MHVQADAFHAVLSALQMQSHSQYYSDTFCGRACYCAAGLADSELDIVVMQHADTAVYTFWVLHSKMLAWLMNSVEWYRSSR